jgi:hypothetical protein
MLNPSRALPLTLTAAIALLSGCALAPAEEVKLAEREARECRTGSSICRKPDGTISDARTVSGEAARDAGGTGAAKPKPGQQ